MRSTVIRWREASKDVLALAQGGICTHTHPEAGRSDLCASERESLTAGACQPRASDSLKGTKEIAAMLALISSVAGLEGKR